MSQGERVKAIRKALSLTQEKFGTRLGVSNTAICKIEQSDRPLTDQMSKEICKQFGVNYEWLLFGSGEMFSDGPQDILNEPMSQGERIKAIRNALKLTQEKFCAKLGVVKSAISKIEVNENSLSDLMAKSICREYNVNYDWLMYGDGEMFSDLSRSILNELCEQYNLDYFDRKLLQEYLKLTPEDRTVLKQYIKNVFGE